MGLFYPSCVINFALRFDEALTLAPGTLVAQETDDYLTNVLSDDGVLPAPDIQVPVVERTDNLSQVLGVVPQTCTVEMAGYRQAWKFNLSMPYRDFPLDPRMIRSLGVEIHFGAVDAGDFAQGMAAFTPQTGSDRRPSVLATRDKSGTPNYRTLALEGLADSITVDHDQKGSTVHIEGRDLRGLLLDQPIRPEQLRTVDLTQSINQVVRSILMLAPLYRERLTANPPTMSVEVNPAEWDNGIIPSPAVEGDLTRCQLGARGEHPGVQVPSDANKINFWDQIIIYCYLVGAVPYFQGRQLWIRPSYSLYDARRQDTNFNPAVGSPFKGGKPRLVTYGTTTKSSETFGYRRMVYGENIDTLKFERKLGGVKVPVIECVSVDTSSKTRGKGRLLRVRWPKDTTSPAAQVGTVAPDGGASQKDILRISVPGIKNKQRLEDIARSLYEEIGRGEMGGSCTTKDLSSFGGDNSDPDLVFLRPGDPVEFRINSAGLGSRPAVVSELTTQDGRSYEEQVSAVMARLGDETLARVLVASQRGSVAALQRTFRTNTVRFNWESGGLGIDFDFQNYVEARYA